MTRGKTADPFWAGFVKRAGSAPSVISDWFAESEAKDAELAEKKRRPLSDIDARDAAMDYPPDVYHRYGP